MSVSLTKSGIATVDRIGWDAFNESEDLKMQVERYKELHGHYPESVLADPIYGTRENRRWLAEKRIRYCGKPLGRPRKETSETRAELARAKKQRQAEYRERIPIEGKFGQGKNGYATVLHQGKNRQNKPGLDKEHIPGDESVGSRESFSLAHKNYGSWRKHRA